MAGEPLLTRVKICGLCRPEDGRAAAAGGADYVGVILARGRGRSKGLAEAAAIYEAAGVARVGVFADSGIVEVVAAARALALDVVQLHGSEAESDVGEIRRAGGWRVWKAVRASGGESFAREVGRWADRVDGLLVDGGEGGKGERFAWTAVAPFRASVPAAVEFIVAGGLSPENVAEAIGILGPDVVDVSSGVESRPCVKSADRIRSFVAAARPTASQPGP